MNSTLRPGWKPGFGIVYTWFGMDKNGRIGVFVNNCWGELPSVLLEQSAAEYMLDSISEYVCEESEIYTIIPPDKNGDFSVDMYPAWTGPKTKEKVKQLYDDISGHKNPLSYGNLSKNKGFYVYFAVEGSFPGEDYPVGYDGNTDMGDYYRYLVPNVFGSMEDFPDELKVGIVESKTIDFNIDRLIPGNSIDKHFNRVFK
ncbi:hypothetical protein [Klebsiella spallanzanii]|jgi:hypothetical protein|uniref:Uncharacterized protein n=1 Tax=Klebsiella spallanzanii TaxID=2587528 RepID=A0A564L5H8_9ENTR|nr:hypothetical protein [Klebsiella spallanzanii]VUS76788.1 hypothetical protein SB6408_05302 [Klebsiella spallanzanii]